MADKPYPPFMRTVPVHAGDAERCREVGLMGGGALIMVFTLAWWIGDQYNPACNGTGDAASGPHSGTECAQANLAILPFFLLFAVTMICWGYVRWRSTLALTPDGITRRTGPRRHRVPWSQVRGVEVTSVDTTSRGILQGLVTATGMDTLWRVEAVVKDGTRDARVTLIEMRSEQQARAWAAVIRDWLRTHHPGR